MQLNAYPAIGNWSVLPSWIPVPDMGALPVNSFLLKGDEPMLMDTGVSATGPEFLEELASRIDPADLRWIWLSHMDADHIGNLERVLNAAPRAGIITNFLGMGKLNLAGFDIGRVHLLNSGDELEINGHRLRPVRPAYYDAPETIGFYDATDGVLFSADSFGALFECPVASLDEVPAALLRDGMQIWSSIDAPWLSDTDPEAFARTLAAIDRLDPAIVLSSHLPLVRKGAGRLTRILAEGRAHVSAAAPDPLHLTQLAAAFASHAGSEERNTSCPA
ncbi:MAG: MBL fold metallo-hydrolase [Hyphomonas sp.]